MPAYLDRDISGQGDDDLSGSAVLYLVLHVTSIGDEARLVTPLVSDLYLRFGWFAFGDSLDVIGGSRDYWRDPVWINFLDTLWTPVPSTAAPNALSIVATRFRWNLSLGAAAHVYIYGS